MLYFSKINQRFLCFERVVAMFGVKAISYGTLRNYLNKDINLIEKDKARMGNKEFKDTYTPLSREATKTSKLEKFGCQMDMIWK